MRKTIWCLTQKKEQAMNNYGVLLTDQTNQKAAGIITFFRKGIIKASELDESWTKEMFQIKRLEGIFCRNEVCDPLDYIFIQEELVRNIYDFIWNSWFQKDYNIDHISDRELKFECHRIEFYLNHYGFSFLEHPIGAKVICFDKNMARKNAPYFELNDKWKWNYFIPVRKLSDKLRYKTLERVYEIHQDHFRGIKDKIDLVDLPEFNMIEKNRIPVFLIGRWWSSPYPTLKDIPGFINGEKLAVYIHNIGLDMTFYLLTKDVQNDHDYVGRYRLTEFLDKY
jgi:hypothetical protein